MVCPELRNLGRGITAVSQSGASRVSIFL